MIFLKDFEPFFAGSEIDISRLIQQNIEKKALLVGNTHIRMLPLPGMNMRGCC